MVRVVKNSRTSLVTCCYTVWQFKCATVLHMYVPMSCYDKLQPVICLYLATGPSHGLLEHHVTSCYWQQFHIHFVHI